MSDRRLVLASGALVMAMLVASLFTFLSLPEGARVPIHFGLDGHADGWAPARIGLFLLPVIALLISALFLVLPSIDPRGGNLRRSGQAYRTICLATLTLLAAIQILVIAGGLGIGLANGHFVIAVVGLFCATIGNFLAKLRWNYTVGIRTPWTLADETVWDKTHRLGGWCFVLGGLGLFAAALLLPDPGPLPAVTGVVLAAMVLVPVIKSYLLWRERHRAGA